MFARLCLGTNCYFCGKPLLDELPQGKPGWWSIQDKVTIHHLDGVHSNDEPSNLAPCHGPCHRQYHIQERAGKVTSTKLE